MENRWTILKSELSRYSQLLTRLAHEVLGRTLDELPATNPQVYY